MFPVETGVFGVNEIYLSFDNHHSNDQGNGDNKLKNDKATSEQRLASTFYFTTF